MNGRPCIDLQSRPSVRNATLELPLHAEGRAKEKKLIQEHFQQMSDVEEGGAGSGEDGGGSDAGSSEDEDEVRSR